MKANKIFEELLEASKPHACATRKHAKVLYEPILPKTPWPPEN